MSGRPDLQIKKQTIIRGRKHWILPKDHFKTRFVFFSILGGVSLLSLDPGPKGVSNLQSSVERPSDKLVAISSC